MGIFLKYIILYYFVENKNSNFAIGHFKLVQLILDPRAKREPEFRVASIPVSLYV